MSGTGNPFGPLAPAQAQQGNTYHGNVGSQATGFLQQLLGGLQQENDRRRGLAQEKTKDDELNRQIAQGKLDQLTKVLRANPGKQLDPKVVAQVKLLSKQAGALDPTQMTTTSPNPLGTGTTKQPGVGLNNADPQVTAKLDKDVTLPHESLDMSVLDPKPNYAEATEQTKVYGNSLPPGAAKKAFYSQFSNVPEGAVDAPPVHTGTEIVNAQKLVGQTVHDLTSGTGSAAGTRFALGALRGYVDSGDISMPDAQALLTDPSVVSPIANAKVAQYAQLGLSEKALTSYRDMLTVTKPKQWAAELAVHQQNANSATERADTGKANEFSLANLRNQQASVLAQNATSNATKAEAAVAQAQASMDRNDLTAMRANQTAVNQTVTALNTTYGKLIAQENAMITQGDDLGTKGDGGIFDQTLAAKAALDKAQAVQIKLNQTVKIAPTQALQRGTGNNTAQVGENQFKAGSPVPGEKGYKFTGEKQGDLYVVVGPDGSRQGFRP